MTDIAKGLAAALVATIVLSMLMIANRMMGLMRQLSFASRSDYLGDL